MEDDGAAERAPEKAAAPPARKEAVEKGFREIWKELFSSPVHLDSALSKQSKNLKTTLAQILPPILLKPASLAEALGIGVAEGEPWTHRPHLARWRPAELMASRVYENMTHRLVEVSAGPADFPPEMVTEWEAAWGKAGAKRLVEALGEAPPLSLRASRKLGAKGLLEALLEGGRLPVRAEASPISPLGVRLSGYAPVLQTPLHKEGGFEIQDEGSQVMALFALWPELYAPLLSKEPGHAPSAKAKLAPVPANPPAWTVVDACAGAGGKSLAMADALAGKGRVYSYDVSERKLLALRRRARLAGFNSIQAVAVPEGEEATKLARFRGRADAVLVDAPCSGWGVLRRNPDIKWRQTKDSLDRMPVIQARLLETYSMLVKPGGHLTYGVCTFRPQETVEITRAFLAAHPEFEAGPGGYLGPSGSDGFFMQFFRRRAKGK